MKQILSIVVILILIATTTSIAQSVNVPNGSVLYHWMDRLEIKSGKMAPFHTSHKFYRRSDVTQYALTLDTMYNVSLTDGDLEDLKFIYADNGNYLDSTTFASKFHPKYKKSEKPFLKYFWKTPANYLEVGNEDYNIIVSPLVSWQVGNERTESNSAGYLGQVVGGIIQGNINNKVHFYTDLQIYFDRHQANVRRYIAKNNAIPGQNQFRGNNTYGSLDSLYDYFNSEAYIDFDITKNIHLQFGNGKNIIGNGFRSVLLSDFSDNYLYLKLNTKFGAFEYQNIFAEMRSFSPNSTATGDLSKKYYAAHHLSVNILKNLNVGILEAIILSRENGFELNYLNPVIFYRSAERALDSPDNAFAGLDFKWNFLKRFSLYGQLGIDELHSSQLIINPNSWAHKFSRQIGLKYIDMFGIDHLDLQLEYNSARPYTYSHFDSTTSYTHQSQALAHPLGANFREFVGVLRYQPNTKLFLEARLMAASIGRDTLGSNWGSDLTKSYFTRENDVSLIAQGVRSDILMFDFMASYMLRHNFTIDFNLNYRNENSVIDAYDYNQLFVTLGFRYNFWKKRYLF